MLKHADKIREHAGKIVEEARSEKREVITIVAGQIVRDLHLNNLTPAVCSALASKRFQSQCHVILLGRDGPPSGQSTTTRFTFQILEPSGAVQAPDAAFLALRGAAKEAFAPFGGGEAFLKHERREFGGA